MRAVTCAAHTMDSPAAHAVGSRIAVMNSTRRRPAARGLLPERTMSTHASRSNHSAARPALVRLAIGLPVAMLALVPMTQSLAAQVAPVQSGAQEPTIATSARGESRVTPDRATVHVYLRRVDLEELHHR